MHVGVNRLETIILTIMSQVKVNDQKTIQGWAFFDWANSAYALIITVAIFPGYFEAVTDDTITVLGTDMTSSAFYAFCVTAAYILIATITPLLSGIADYGGKRKNFMKFFTTLGALSCIGLFFFNDMNTLWIGAVGFILSTIGFAGALVFYNSYLPQIATPDEYDRVSAKGFSYGYVGSVILLLFNLLMIQKPELFGIEDALLPIRISFVLVGLWWLGFAQITFKRMPKDEQQPLHADAIRKGFKEIKEVWHKMKDQVNTRSFLLAYFCYTAGVQTILYMAATFAQVELGLGTFDLIIVTLILQLVAIGGAFGFAALSARKGNKYSLITMLIIWLAICIVAYYVHTEIEFFILCAAVGLVMGGIQSLSRSTYSKLLGDTTEDLASYFSFYDVLQKLAIIFGTFSFGLIAQITGGMRSSIVALGLFFLAGIIILKFKVTIQDNEIITSPE